MGQCSDFRILVLGEGGDEHLLEEVHEGADAMDVDDEGVEELGGEEVEEGDGEPQEGIERSDHFINVVVDWLFDF